MRKGSITPFQLMAGRRVIGGHLISLWITEIFVSIASHELPTGMCDLV